MPVRFRWPAYAGLSTALAAVVVLRAVTLRPNFYSAAVFLSNSSTNVIVLTNLLFVAACSFILLMQKVLYGPLRPIEIEQLYEKAWFAVTETCLAMTIFRGEIGLKFLAMFFALLAGKVWGWIGEGRVEVLEQGQGNNRTFAYTRLALSLGIGVAFSMGMLEYAVDQVARMPRPDMMVMFGFEFAILSISSLSTAARMAINMSELAIIRDQKRKKIAAIKVQRQQEVRLAIIREAQRAGAEDAQPMEETPIMSVAEARRRAEETIDENDIEVDGWEGKGRWIFYLDLATDFCKLVVYLSFFFILLIFYGLPIHILRDVFLTCRSFFKRIGDFIRYRTATKDMNERYPDATAEEIAQQDVCIICRDEMRPYQPVQGGQRDPVAERNRPKKLPCGHVLHFRCLRDWLERQQICPTCRRPVLAADQAGPANPAAGQRGQGLHGGQQGPRVFQFGPLRIGIGAARGNNMFEELQNQLAVEQPQPNPAAANGNGPQQYGFGIRWDGLRRRSARRTRQGGTITEQLEAANRAIQREIDELRLDAMELERLVSTAEQVLRIREATQAGTRNSAVPATVTHSTATVLTPDRQQNVLEAGSDQLPDGLTLPAGWSMMPLQQHQGPSPNMPAMQLPLLPQMMPNGMFGMVQGQMPPMQFGQQLHPQMQFPGMGQAQGQPHGQGQVPFVFANNAHAHMHPIVNGAVHAGMPQMGTPSAQQQPQPQHYTPGSIQYQDYPPPSRAVSAPTDNAGTASSVVEGRPNSLNGRIQEALRPWSDTLSQINGEGTVLRQEPQPTSHQPSLPSQDTSTSETTNGVSLPSWGSSVEQDQSRTAQAAHSPHATNGDVEGTEITETESLDSSRTKNPRSVTVEDAEDPA